MEGPPAMLYAASCQRPPTPPFLFTQMTNEPGEADHVDSGVAFVIKTTKLAFIVRHRFSSMGDNHEQCSNCTAETQIVASKTYDKKTKNRQTAGNLPARPLCTTG